MMRRASRARTLREAEAGTARFCPPRLPAVCADPESSGTADFDGVVSGAGTAPVSCDTAPEFCDRSRFDVMSPPPTTELVEATALHRVIALEV